MSDSASTPQETGNQPDRKQGRKQMLLRLDPAVHDALSKWAADNLRSVNAQIEIVLRQALKDAGRDPRPAPMRRPGRPRKSE
ncbi:toxin-antitoxin system HicB family antitoxin [Actinomycetaceae bacterium L2_0104]